MGYVCLWISIATGIAAGLFLKEGTNIVGEAPENSSEMTTWMLNMITNPYTLSALFFFIVTGITFSIALSRLKLSYIYPLFMAVPLVVTPLLALPIFDEKVPWMGWLGIVIICVGVFLISMRRSASDDTI